MKKYLFIVFLFSQTMIYSQFNDFFFKDKNLISGGAGVTWIDGQPYYSVRFTPEFNIGKIGLGFDLRLDIDANGKLRGENYNEFSDYLSLIRYVRYGQKQDPFYARLGALDYTSLGHGTIISSYRNTPGFDTRKVGLEVGLDLEKIGFEALYSNFGEAGLVGLRGFVRPLQFNEDFDTPIIKNLELGVSYVTDINEYTGVVAGNYNKNTDKFTPTDDKGSLSVLGFDIGLPIVQSDLLNLELYLDYNKIINYGSGVASGIVLDFHGLGLVELKAKLERRWNGKNYIPSYFNALYEIERFKLDKETSIVSSKIQMLNNDVDFGNGYHGELLVRILGTLDIFGSYQRLDKYSDSGILHLFTDILPDNSTLVARAGYDKINIRDEKDLFTLDDRSYFYTEVGYKPLPYIVASIVYHWNFTPVRDSNDNIIDYATQKRIEPRISFIYTF